LPVLRRQLQKGNHPAARVAALLLDEFGELEDVVRLRAYAKTYSRRGHIGSQLGRSLSKRVGPKLEIFDLGRVRVRVGERVIDVSAMRRKPASLLLYLVTRPSHTATRDEVLDQLWPDTAPSSAANSLNQSLYYLRRDIDPWYEDNLSIEYVPYEGELVWLDPDLVRVASIAFLDLTRASTDGERRRSALEIVEGYGGRFAPEFEYEDWAITWRSRLQVAFLEFSQQSVDELMRRGDVAGARDVALKALEAEPDARDLERKLIALYWRLGSKAAARAQYSHFAALERADGFDPPTFDALCSEELRGR
jgi:DNA-binding SARP family transcriptional activator